MITAEDESTFQSFFESIAGPMFFKSVSNIEVTYEVNNFVVYQNLTATATQKVKMPVRFEILGFDPSVTLGVEAMVVINDPDEFVRTSQLVGDVVSETKVGKSLQAMTEKVAEAYGEIKRVLHVE